MSLKNYLVLFFVSMFIALEVRALERLWPAPVSTNSTLADSLMLTDSQKLVTFGEAAANNDTVFTVAEIKIWSADRKLLNTFKYVGNKGTGNTIVQPYKLFRSNNSNQFWAVLRERVMPGPGFVITWLQMDSQGHVLHTITQTPLGNTSGLVEDYSIIDTIENERLGICHFNGIYDQQKLSAELRCWNKTSHQPGIQFAVPVLEDEGFLGQNASLKLNPDGSFLIATPTRLRKFSLNGTLLWTVTQPSTQFEILDLSTIILVHPYHGSYLINSVQGKLGATIPFKASLVTVPVGSNKTFFLGRTLMKTEKDSSWDYEITAWETRNLRQLWNKKIDLGEQDLLSKIWVDSQNRLWASGNSVDYPFPYLSRRNNLLTLVFEPSTGQELKRFHELGGGNPTSFVSFKNVFYITTLFGKLFGYRE